MPWYAVVALDDALAATRALLTPLDAGQWLRLALVVFFLGSVGGGGPSATAGSSTPGPSVAPPDGSSGVLADLLSMEAADLLPVAVAVAGVALLVGLAYALVGSVMEFVFVESLRRRRVRVRRYADQHRWQALGLFGFRLALGLAVVVPATALALVAVAGGESAISLGLVVAFVPVLVGLGAVAAVVDAFTTGFVVPVMVRTNRGVVGAWRLFWPTLTGQWKQYGVYALVRVGLALAVGVLASVVGGVVGAVVLAPLAVLGVLSVTGLATPVTILSNPVGLALAMLVALSYLVVLTAAVAVAFVPVRTFLRYHALLVLGDTEPQFDLLPELRREVRERT